MHEIKRLKNIPYRILDFIHFPERNMPCTKDGMIRMAIDGKRLLQFDYDECRRIVEPHVYGKKNDRDGIMNYQIRGKSSTGELGWKRMHLEKIPKMRILRERFPGKRPMKGNHSSWDEFYDIVDE